MKTAIFAVCALLLAMLSNRQAAALVIDDFSAGPFAVTMNSSTTSINQLQTGLNPASVVDGSRRVGSALNYPILATESADLAVGSHSFRLHNFGDVEYYLISWGIQSLPQGPASLALNENLLAGGYTGFRIDVAALASAHSATINLRSGVNEGSIKSGFANVSLAATTTGYSQFVPFSSFLNVDFSNIDYISFGSPITHEGFDLTLSGIYTAKAGDFDGDNDVDGADFIAWQTHFPKASGAMFDQGDSNGDGDVDGADFMVWKSQFPMSPAIVTVPEPTAILLMSLSLSASYAAQGLRRRA